MPSPGSDYLVSYDVACRKRWRRVFRLLQGYGEWVQLSVFRCRLDRRRRARMAAELDALIDAGEDRLLIARLDDEERTGSALADTSAPDSGRALIL